MKNLLVLVVLVFCTNITAQSQDELPEAKMLAKLSNLEGNWQGEGWTQQGNIRHEFRQVEKVAFKLNNTVLQIEGKGYVADSLIFQAMALISYNNEERNYRFNSFLADGKYTEATGSFNDDDSFDWQFNLANGGQIKYHIIFSESNWQEKGYYSPDGGVQWYPFLEMNLKKL